MPQACEHAQLICHAPCRPPQHLYEGGLQRHLFLPFIAKLEKACISHDMNSTTDYRKRAHYRRGLWFAKRPYRPDPGAELKERFNEMVRNLGLELAARTIKVQMGRKIEVPEAGTWKGKLSCTHLIHKLFQFHQPHLQSCMQTCRQALPASIGMSVSVS